MKQPSWFSYAEQEKQKKTPEKVCFYFIIQQKAQHVRRAAIYFFKLQKLINFDPSEKYCNTYITAKKR